MVSNTHNIFGVKFNVLGYKEIIEFLLLKMNRKGYICFPDLYNICRANQSPLLKRIYNESTLTLPDGKPSQIMLKKKGLRNTTTISGYWLCKRLLDTDLTHYFYGTSKLNLEIMMKKINQEFPKSRIIGYKSPPFVELDNIERNKQIREELNSIFTQKPDIIWVGISSPKQDYLMHYFNEKSTGTIMVGVGAVFDYFAGTAHMGPEWIKNLGLRWLFQLIKDPKRYFLRVKYILLNFPRLLIKHS